MDFLLLVGAALLGGLIAFYLPKFVSNQYKLVLVFSGAYLFAITITHILPELFAENKNAMLTGIFILVGFFLQQGLEFISQGVEHGHIHVHRHGISHNASAAVPVMLALGLHAFLEGGMLTQVQAHGSGEARTNTLLWGILLHKAPEAFALMSVLVCELSRRKAFFFLLIFSLASPLGLYLSNYLIVLDALPAGFFHYLFAVVCGNFLHISTTVVFESSADHHFNIRKTAVAILGSLVAVVAELLF